jgi:quercetin dioxygenase-like cupin family protein
MRKLPGLSTIVAAVALLASANVAYATPPSGQFSSSEYGRAQQVDNGKVVVPTGHDVDSSTYSLAPGADTGWRTGPGTTALAVTKGVLKVEQAPGCTSRDLAAGNATVLQPGQFRLHNAGQEPVELLANFSGLPHGGGAPLVDGSTDPAPACAGFAVAGAANGISVDKSFRGDPSPYFKQAPTAHEGHGGGEATGTSKELAVEAGKDAFMETFELQPGFSTGWFAHTPHVAIITKGTWAFYGDKDGKCQIEELYHPGDAWVHPVHRHLGAVQGNEPVEITVFGFNLKHGQAMPVFGSNPDHLDFTQAPPADCPTQLR